MPTENSDTIVPITATNFSTESNNVLLQTEQPVQNLPMEESAIEKVRILFDSGSQRSCLNEHV